MKKVFLLMFILFMGLSSNDCFSQEEEQEEWQKEVIEQVTPTPPPVWVPGYWSWPVWNVLPVYIEGYWQYFD